MKPHSRHTAVLIAVVLAVLPAACSPSATSSDAPTASDAATSATSPPGSTSGDPASTAPDDDPSPDAAALIEWMTLACISMTPGEPLEIIDAEVIHADNRGTLAELARETVKLYDTQLDLLRDLPEPPTPEAKTYVADFRKSVRGAKSSWKLVASAADQEDVSLKDLRSFVKFAGLMTTVVNSPLPPKPGPLAEAYMASWRCTAVR